MRTHYGLKIGKKTVTSNKLYVSDKTAEPPPYKLYSGNKTAKPYRSQKNNEVGADIYSTSKSKEGEKKVVIRLYDYWVYDNSRKYYLKVSYYFDTDTIEITTNVNVISGLFFKELWKKTVQNLMDVLIEIYGKHVKESKVEGLKDTYTKFEYQVRTTLSEKLQTFEKETLKKESGE